MTTPFVSVVMTSYNRGHYIGQAIDSILAQNRSFPIEIIVGDDGSTDNSRELLLAYAEKHPGVFVLNFQERNVGFGPNWASTCKLARGKYIAFLDDDDYWCDDNRLQEMVVHMEAHSECGLLYQIVTFWMSKQDIMNPPICVFQNMRRTYAIIWILEASPSCSVRLSFVNHLWMNM